MIPAGLLIGLAMLGPAPPADPTSADSVTLPDGKVVLGQLLDSERPGTHVMLVRRAWAKAKLPEKLAAWEKAEAPQVLKAEGRRRERLLAWKRERKPDPTGDDRIGAWIDRELARPAGASKSSLMVVRLGRAEVKATERKSKKDNRMLRLGWLSDLPDVEGMSGEELARALEGRGFSTQGETPVSVEPLLPIQPEGDARWLVRRAATEVLNDPGGRLLRYQGMVLPEPEAGGAPPAGASLDAALGSLKELLGDAPPVDPLAAKLRELARQGRAGVVVTRLELAPDFSSAAVETTLWARAGDRWYPGVVRSAGVRPDDLPPDSAEGLADDPQVKAAFGLVEGLGLGEVPPELKRRSLRMGAATRKALGQARGALDQDLNALGLSLEPPRQAAPAARP